jgi:hypothetical protein
MLWGRGPEVRPWAKGLGPTDPKRIATWAQLEAESIRQRRHLGYIAPPCECLECKMPDPKAVAPPEPKPKPRKRKRPVRKQTLDMRTGEQRAWDNLRLAREKRRLERDDL